MSPEFNDKSTLEQELAVGALLDEVNMLLKEWQPLGEMKRMDNEVAEILSSQEYESFIRYKNFCLTELGKLNTTSGINGALYSAIERGFILGYWFGMQRKDANPI